MSSSCRCQNGGKKNQKSHCARYSLSLKTGSLESTPQLPRALGQRMEPRLHWEERLRYGSGFHYPIANKSSCLMCRAFVSCLHVPSRQTTRLGLRNQSGTQSLVFGSVGLYLLPCTSQSPRDPSILMSTPYLHMFVVHSNRCIHRSVLGSRRKDASGEDYPVHGSLPPCQISAHLHVPLRVVTYKDSHPPAPTLSLTNGLTLPSYIADCNHRSVAIILIPLALSTIPPPWMLQDGQGGCRG